MLRSSPEAFWVLPEWLSTPRCIGDIGNENLRQHHFDDGNLLVIFWVFMALRPASTMDIMPGDKGRWHGYAPAGYIGAHPSNRGPHSCTWSATTACAQWRAARQNGTA